ncbi:MAG: nitroreductase family protein [Ignavibacteria bacterium]|nr:nitroreductase family protein [Ignavibacteria bacterium]
METLKAILTRRSIRQFTPQVVSKDLINQILRAGMQAPSARNKRPWELIVVTERKLLDEIPKFHPYAEMCMQAPLAVVVCGDKELEQTIEYIIQDCSALTENILLACHDLNLGAVWLGVYPRKERIEGLRKLFHLPPNIIPITLVAIGYPAEMKEAENRYEPHKVHYNKW